MTSTTNRFLTAAIVAAFTLCAQVPTAEITGTVTDSSGGAVANATVTITNIDTNAGRTLVTNPSGVYDAPALPPGSYSVKVSMSGFRTALNNKVLIEVGQVDRLDFALQVGNVSETVTVKDSAPTIDTETATVGTVVENKPIQELPLNGRNYLQLASLVPGATTYGPVLNVAQTRLAGDRSNFGLNVAGQREEFNHYTLDGVENTDPNFSGYLFQPSVDALQEFKVETSTYGAEYGRGIAQINVVTKSGTNEYHGTLWEFLRNSNLDAKNFFDTVGAIPPFKRNQFGGTLGGPVQIPKIVNGKNKLFFFLNYEGTRQVKAQSTVSSVPLASDRTGNFSTSKPIIYDPATRVLSPDGTKVLSQSAFAGNVIPSSRISPVSLFALNHFFPVPNQNVNSYTNNYLSNESAIANSDQGTARVDYQQSSNSSFQFRYSHMNEPQYTPGLFPGQGTNNSTVTDQGVLGHTWVIGANKVNEFKFGLSRLAITNLQANAYQNDYVAQMGLTGLTDIPLFYGSPVISINGLSPVGDNPNGPYENFDTIFEWTDNFSWTHDTHTIKFGGDFLRTRFNMTGNDVARGRFSFNGQYTSLAGVAPATQNSVADYLLGNMSLSESQTGLVVSQMRNYSLNFYFQDQWKVTPKLTVNYGIRYELQPGYNDTQDRIVNLDFNWANQIVPTYVRAGTGNPYQGNPPFPLPATIPYVRDGRFGNTTFKTPFRQWAPRLGLAYSLNSKTVIRAGAGIFYVRDIADAMFDLERNAPFTLRRSISSNTLIPNQSWSAPFAVVGSPTLTPAWQWGDPQPYVGQWSFTVQRQLTQDMSLEAGYVGSAGIHLNRYLYYNEAPPGGPGNYNLRRPFPQLGDVQDVAAASHSNYNALNLRLQQRFAHGFTLLSSFSWEKSIDNGSGIRPPGTESYVPQDMNNLALERSLSSFDFGTRWTTSGLYELPFGKGKLLLKSANHFVDLLVGGWQLGGIYTLQGGFPFSAACTSNSTYMNNSAQCRPDATGIAPSLSNPSPNEWFNTAAFVNRIGFVPGTGPYRVGTSGRNVIRGPGISELDASLFKFFHLTERTNLEFRSEIFNLPNHPIFANPGATVGTASYGVISATNLPSREIQFALKLNF